ncbi:MAG: hypothetical protein HRT57_13270 [Crocinitomicaceae bacterium]|nr:hypothetical protein [Crocinitomicaceae bacterium]
MRLIIFLLFVSIFNPNDGVAQGLESIYSGEERSADIGRIKRKYGKLKEESISKNELNGYLKNNVLGLPF